MFIHFPCPFNRAKSPTTCNSKNPLHYTYEMPSMPIIASKCDKMIRCLLDVCLLPVVCTIGTLNSQKYLSFLSLSFPIPLLFPSLPPLALLTQQSPYKSKLLHKKELGQGFYRYPTAGIFCRCFKLTAFYCLFPGVLLFLISITCLSNNV